MDTRRLVAELVFQKRGKFLDQPNSGLQKLHLVVIRFDVEQRPPAAIRCDVVWYGKFRLKEGESVLVLRRVIDYKSPSSSGPLNGAILKS